jgi:hypothetical protein
MAKGILKFDLPEEEMSHLRAVRAWDILMVLYDFDQWLRRADDADKPATLVEIREKFYELLKDYEINLERLSHERGR